jgi:hypothetical protein
MLRTSRTRERPPHSGVERPAFDAANTYNHSSGNLTSSPVTDQPMIIRWISDVPSKIVKIVDYGAVYAGQSPITPMVSARIQHGLFEGNDGFCPAPCAIAARGADGLQSADEGGKKLEDNLGVVLFAGRTLQVHRRYICALTCSYTRFSIPARAGSGAQTGTHAG